MEIESGEVMNDLTLGLIYAVKHSEKSAKESIIDFLSEYTGTPKQYYSDNELVRIIRDSFVDYLKTADNPAFEVWQYFDAKRQQENFKDVFPEQHKKYAERDNCMDIDPVSRTVVFLAQPAYEQDV